jgi:hypothetical protein
MTINFQADFYEKDGGCGRVTYMVDMMAHWGGGGCGEAGRGCDSEREALM